ncbi:flagellar motor switch protein FliN [Novosphingobium sp. M1R2S20]|uniref:Flagellar motor switch protein FliN n=1 Tax=Novosphingobium rhizovicinum TaxID=3228928 RepID=A0ABV3R9E5_9SPHN
MTNETNTQDVIPSTFEAPLEDFDDALLPGGTDTTAVVSQPVNDADEMEAIFDVPVKVKAVLGGARVQIGELIQMRCGSVVELDRRVGEPVDVFVNDRFIARGELVLIDGSLGVTLTEIVKQDG